MCTLDWQCIRAPKAFTSLWQGNKISQDMLIGVIDFICPVFQTDMSLVLVGDTKSASVPWPPQKCLSPVYPPQDKSVWTLKRDDEYLAD